MKVPARLHGFHDPDLADNCFAVMMFSTFGTNGMYK